MIPAYSLLLSLSASGHAFFFSSFLLCHHFPPSSSCSLLMIFYIQSLLLTFSFACLSKPPSAPPCPSLSPSLFPSGTSFQVVTITATVAVQSPASPTWRAPFCWWISSSTSRGVGEVEGAKCNPKKKKECWGRAGGTEMGDVGTNCINLFEVRKSQHGLVQ